MIKSEQYPFFQPNQVISDEIINQIPGHLEPKDRAICKHGIGRGIVCGFELSLQPKAVILNKGTGLTSEGFLVSIESPLTFRFARSFTPKATYPPFQKADGSGTIELLELLPGKPENDDVFSPVADLDLSLYVVILYLDAFQEDLTTCLPDHCDNQGALNRLSWYALLIRRTHALEIIKAQDGRLGKAMMENEVTAILHAGYDQKNLVLAKPLLTSSNLTAYSKLTANYSSVCRKEMERFVTAFKAAYKCYRNILEEEDISLVIQSLFSSFQSMKNGKGLQYFWDFLDDLFHAFNEFLEKAFTLTEKCGTGQGLFSHHLFIGPGKETTGCRPTIFRHFFTPARKDEFYGSRSREVLFLFRRITVMITNFKWRPELTTLRLTPDYMGKQLSRRGVGYYYDFHNVSSYWSVDAARRCQGSLLPTYHRQGDELLEQTLIDCNHARVEGHMYRGKEKVIKELEALRKKYNLIFNIKCLDLGDVPEFSSGGCSIESLRILYEIARLDIICFLEDKIRFLSSVIKQDLEFDTPEEEREEREAEKKPTRIEKAQKLNYLDVIDFTRNSFFETQVRIAGSKKTAVPPQAAAAPFTERIVEDAAPASLEMEVPGAGPSPIKGFSPFIGRKESRFEKEFEETDLAKETVPTGVKEIVDRIKPITRKPAAEPFEATFIPTAGPKEKETPVEEDSTSFVIKAKEIAFAFPKTPVTEYPAYPKPVLGDRLLQEIIGRLTRLLEELPDEVHDYDGDTVNEAYDEIKDKALSLKDIIEDLLGDPNYQVLGVEYALISELLEIADACLAGRLGTIANMHGREWLAAENSGILSEYIKRHPGIHHCAGVHLPGTLVLVSGYIDKVKETRRIKKLTRPLFTRAPLAVYNNLRGNIYENMLRTAGHFNLKAFRWNKLIRKERIKADISKRPPAPVPAVTLEKKRSVLLDGLIRTIESADEEEIILFDFCHDYVCCSECSEIKYVVLAELKLYLPKVAFCANDTESYAFGVFPEKGVLTGSGVKKVAETYYFVPADSSVGEQIFTYKIGGREIQLVANVFAHPTAGFSYEVQEIDSQAAVVAFDNLSTDGETFHWEFGDGHTSVDHSPVHTFSLLEGNTFKVVLTAKNEGCEHQFEMELSLIPITFFIEEHRDSFCIDDGFAYPLSMEPPGGVLTGDGIETDDNTFHPDRILLKDALNKTVTLKYAVANQVAVTKAVVFAKPQAAFSTKIADSAETSTVILFTNDTDNATAYLWEFGDGESSTLENPTHTYKLGDQTNFNVRLTADNGPCRSVLEKELDLSPLIFKMVSETTIFCESDETAYELTASPPGGIITGPGLIGNSFVPASVDLGDLSSKTITLVYTVGARTATLRATVHRVPVLAFTQVMSATSNGVTVSFNNKSRFASTYLWDFGDGSEPIKGFSVSHFYTREGAFNVRLTGTNFGCLNELVKTVSIKFQDEIEPGIKVPVTPLKAAVERLGSSRSDILLEFGVKPAFLTDFTREMLTAVQAGAAAEYVQKEEIFLEAMDQYIRLANGILELGPDLEPELFEHTVAIHRLSIANVMNMMSRRDKDLDGTSELFQLFENISEVTTSLNLKLKTSSIPVDGFELLPKAAYEGRKNLTGFQAVFAENL
ncbi:MAG: PKD domain-containing protein [Desulfobacteraceae bacterium]|nr:PKD domain-containing protein [Desulfobacteraceae bacterium]